MTPRRLGIIGLSTVALLMPLVPVETTQAEAAPPSMVDINPHAILTYPTDIHGGMVFQSSSRYYWIGDAYGCGFVLGAADAKYCGAVGYRADSLRGPWAGPTLLFDPAPWQARCAAPNYGCFRPHVVWNANTQDWRLWINVAMNFASFSYAVFSADEPLGPYRYIGDAKLSVAFDLPRYGDESLFADGADGYVAYTVIGKDGRHSIAIERLDASYRMGTGESTLLPVKQWIESPSMFKREGLYYLAYSDPICAFCTGAGTSYAVGRSPLGPWMETQHPIHRDSCGSQLSSINAVDGLWLYQSDRWNGSMDEASASQWWGELEFRGSTILPLACGSTLSGWHPAPATGTR
jgi:hypothetical protein